MRVVPHAHCATAVRPLIWTMLQCPNLAPGTVGSPLMVCYISRSKTASTANPLFWRGLETSLNGSNGSQSALPFSQTWRKPRRLKHHSANAA